MKTRVEFRSKKFPPYEGEQEEINPGLWGKRLAEYLKQEFTQIGIETEGIITKTGVASYRSRMSSSISRWHVATNTVTTKCSSALSIPVPRSFANGSRRSIRPRQLVGFLEH